MAQGPMSSILVTIRITFRIQDRPGGRSPKSGFTVLSNYQRILMKFYGEVGVWPRDATDYILVTIRITVRIRESLPDHDPDPGITATILLCWRSAKL